MVPCGPTKWCHMAPYWRSNGSKYYPRTPNGDQTPYLFQQVPTAYHQGIWFDIEYDMVGFLFMQCMMASLKK